MCLTLPLKNVALACNSYTGWVGGAYQCLQLTVRVQSIDFGISYFLLDEHLTVYYTVFEFHEDRCRAAQRVFAEMTYRF